MKTKMFHQFFKCIRIQRLLLICSQVVLKSIPFSFNNFVDFDLKVITRIKSVPSISQHIRACLDISSSVRKLRHFLLAIRTLKICNILIDSLYLFKNLLLNTF